MTTNFDNLYRNLGYKFKNEDFLLQALSHRSIGKQSNERLEFLGDSVLNFIIAAELFRLYSEMTEGELSRLRANLVNGELLAELAREVKIGDYLLLGVGEIKSGGGQRSSILADAMEAVMGAIYLDSDLECCREHILRWYANRLAEAAIVFYKDPKTQLQELVQAKKLPLPTYEIIKIEGAAHAQVFHIKCQIEGISESTMATGTTKRKAEQNAAKLFLTYLGVK